MLTFEVRGYDPEKRLRDETLFCCANGYLGVRGCFEEGAPQGATTIRGTYINGFCEDEPIEYNERLYGFPRSKQVIVNLPDAQTICLYADGTPVRCFDAQAYGLRRTLDMRRGCAMREFLWTKDGATLHVQTERLTSFSLRNLFCIKYTVSSKGYEGLLSFESTLDADVSNFTDPDDPRVSSGSTKMLDEPFMQTNGDMLSAVVRTRRTGRFAACALIHGFDGRSEGISERGGVISARFSCRINDGQSVSLYKYCGYSEADNEEAALFTARDAAQEGLSSGYTHWSELQCGYMSDFFRRSRVEISGDDELQNDLDFCLYGMLCAAGRDGNSSVAAKGLSGEGYEGHYFWDCETYIFPFFAATSPEIARSLLLYRYKKLDAAREHARSLGHMRGALYPWRTITGSECSSYYPSGSAQYHIDADIAHAFAQYWYSSRDVSFLPAICEVLVETARLYMDLGHMLDGGFHIDGVTGPDEYTCIVNNNYYTNAGAAQNLRQACRLCRELKALGGFQELSRRIGVTEQELEDFSRTAERMYYPMDEKLGICKQDDSFLSKKRWEIADIPTENFPLLMHYHPLYINRCQICKQADTVLAHYLYREEDPLVMMRSYEYYEAVTTHDSSLSGCVFSIMAARLGNMEKAMHYFRMTVGIDRKDQNGNTRDGLHIANMGGAYSAVVAGFGGMRLLENGLHLFPLLPKEWKQLRFPICAGNSRVMVEVNRAGCFLRLLEGEPVEIVIYGKRTRVDELGVRAQRSVEGVIFDLDGVITDTAKYHFAAWQRIANEMGIVFTEEDNERLKGVSRADCLEILLSLGKQTLPDEDKQDILKRKNDYYLEALALLSPNDILPGIKESLARLKSRGVPAALFSVSRNTDGILSKLGLSEAFNAVVTGNDISNSKPHFEGYLLAASRMDVDPRLCVMIEDAPAGIAGAKALSMMSVGIGDKASLGAAEHVIESTSQLPSLLEILL